MRQNHPSIHEWSGFVFETSAEFHRGPHDGLVLDFDEIRNHCLLVRMPGAGGDRLFAMMPASPDWERVMSGDLDKDGPFDTLYAYELERGEDGPAFLFRRHDEFGEAVDQF
jgi:hypothetical protein